jgi:hypothetical protein
MEAFLSDVYVRRAISNSRIRTEVIDDDRKHNFPKQRKLET